MSELLEYPIVHWTCVVDFGWIQGKSRFKTMHHAHEWIKQSQSEWQYFTVEKVTAFSGFARVDVMCRTYDVADELDEQRLWQWFRGSPSLERMDQCLEKVEEWFGAESDHYRRFGHFALRAIYNANLRARMMEDDNGDGGDSDE